ncbi:MAG TPA: hypothetical protein V6C81_16100 [Planktothrix sp.]
MTVLFFLLTALTLGLRHGVDWDHIAALVDISAANTDESKRCHQMSLCFCYALGHGFIVFVLGVAAIIFAAILPSWIDGVMERIVGFTLLLLSVYLFASVYQVFKQKKEIVMQSRLMMLISYLKRNAEKVWRHHGKHARDEEKPIAAGGAFTIGVLHGLGAETATQVLVITAAGRASSQILSIEMLMLFVVGLLISNSIIAWIATRGFDSVFNRRPVFVVAGSTAGIFSLCLGLTFALGLSRNLPSIL